MTAPAAKTSGRRLHPTVWVKQIVLFKSIAPVEEIRSIPLSQGMNIIQGLSDESADAFESGHGNGKTTFCRLLRYCLGESAFGQKHVVEEIKHCFPTGYVGAVIAVDGEEWAVLRPLHQGGKSVAKLGVSIPELISAKDALAFERFVDHLNIAPLSTLSNRDVLSGGHSVQWLHLLSVCSRDQESRYDRFWNCRHPRSDSGSPRLTKSDMSLCVRAMLGLLEVNEPVLRSRLAKLEGELHSLQESIKLKRQEPHFHIASLRRRLATEFSIEEAESAPLDPDGLFGVPKATERRISVLTKELEGVKARLAPLDRHISIATAQYRELLEHQAQSMTAGEVTGEGTQVIANALEVLRRSKERIEDLSMKMCPEGRILIGDCEHVQRYLSGLQSEIEHEQANALPQIAQRDQIAADLADRASRQTEPLTRLRAKLDELNEAKNVLLDRRREITRELERIPTVLADLTKWHEVLEGRAPNSDLNELEQRQQRTSAAIDETKKTLTDHINAQQARVSQFTERFHRIVQNVIDSKFKGTINVVEDELQFSINRERSLAGEAYETLAVLLGDLAMLLESSSDSVSHPGILIHDSPREADLNMRLYERLLLVALWSMWDEQCHLPFQYVVTTTTRPPDVLQDPSITKLTLSSGSGSLFGKQLEIGTAEASQGVLFDATAET